MEKKLSKTYWHNFSNKVIKLRFEQKVEIKQCLLSLKQYTVDGILYNEDYDLRKKFVFAKKTHNNYGITFGLGSVLKRKSKIFFPNRDKRNAAMKKFRKLAALCKKPTVFFHFKKLRRIKKEARLNNVVEFKGSIPMGSNDSTLNIHEDDGTKIARIEGRTSFKERVTSAKNAKHSILIQKLIFRGDPVGKLLGGILIKKYQEGVDVKILIDRFINGMDLSKNKTDLKNSKVLFNNLMAAGIRIYGYSCDERFGYRNLNQGINLFRFLAASHEKLWIVDGKDPEKYKETSMAIMGGRNIANEYFALPGKGIESWRDEEIGLKGPIVKKLYRSFQRNFNNKALRFKNYNDDSKCYNHYDPITEKEKYSKFFKEHSKPYNPYTNDFEREHSKNLKENMDKTLDGEGFFGFFTSREPDFHFVKRARYINDHPSEGEHDIFEAYVNLIDNAKEEIHLTNSYFIPPKRIKEALIRASLRGVKIVIITNNLFLNDLPMMTFGARYLYKDMAHPEFDKDKYPKFRPMEIWEWEGKKGDGDLVLGTLHSKFMVVDKKVVIVGSFNVSGSSEKNSETVVIYESKELIKEMMKVNRRDLNYSKKITLEQMNKFKKFKGHGGNPVKDFLQGIIFGKIIRGFL